MGPVGASPSCPRCEIDAPDAGARCASCGFVFFDTAEPPRLPQQSRPALAGGALAATLALAGVLPATREGPPPEPVPARQAEQRLELRFGLVRDYGTSAVLCPGPIVAGHVTRCRLRYGDGVARTVLVRLSPRGELEADIR